MSDSGSGLRIFLSELKRRRVYRVAGVYAFHTLLGFPIGLVLAWAFDITPQGVRRAESTPGARGSWATAIAGLALIPHLGNGVPGYPQEPQAARQRECTVRSGRILAKSEHVSSMTNGAI